MKPSISLVVGSANPIYLSLFCESLKRYTKYPFELFIAVDNMTQERWAVVDWLYRFNEFANVKVQVLGAGFHGVGHNWNLGIKNTAGDWIGILNDDILFTDGWLDRLVDFMEAHPECGAVSPTWYWQGIPPVDVNTLSLENAWDTISAWNDEFSEKAKNYGTLHTGETNYGIQGCFFFLRRKALEKLSTDEVGVEPMPGLFDYQTFPGGNFEDNDMCMRLKRAGYNMRITHNVALHHWGSQTVARDDVKGQLGNFYQRNRPSFYKKWGISHRFSEPFSVHNSILIIGNDQYPLLGGD